MADFLERLTKRTLGRLDVVRPDLAPTFGARAMDGLDRQSDTLSISAQAAGRIASPATPFDVRTRVARNDDRQANAFSEVARIDVPPPPSDPSPTIEQTFDRIAVDDRSSTAIAVSMPAPSAPSPRRPDRDQPSPARAAVAAHEDRSASRERSSATVSITIGRIDVRAIPAAAPAPQVTKARPNGLRTLEHYLAERNGRRA